MVVYCKDLDLGVPGPNAQCYKWLFTPTPSPPPARVSPGRRPPDWQTQESWSHSCWHSEHFKPSHIPILFSRGQKCHSSLIEVVKCPADSLPVWSVIQDISNDILNRWIALVLQQQSTCMITIIHFNDMSNCPNRYNTAGRVSKEVYSGDSVCRV